MTVQELTIRVNLDAGSTIKGLGTLNKTFGNLGNLVTGAFSGFGHTLKNITSSVADLGLQLGTSIVSEAVSLEDALSGVRKTANLSAEQVRELGNRVRDFSTNTFQGTISSQQLAEALEIAGQVGLFAGKSFAEGSDDALAFSKAMVVAGETFGGMQIGTIAESLGLLHKRFSDSIPDISRLVSVINHFGDSTQRSEKWLSNLAGRLAESAALTGLSEHATVALSAALGGINQAAQKSGTAMSRVLKKMRSDSDDFADAFGINADVFNRLVRDDMQTALVVLADRLKGLSGSSEGIDTILAGLKDLQLTGSGVSNVMLGLGAASEQLRQYLKEGEEEWHKNTSAMDAFWNSMDRLSKVWKGLGTIWKNTMGPIGDMLVPLLKDLLKEVSAIAIEFRNWFLETEFIKTTLPAAFENVKGQLSGLLQQAVEFVKHLDWSAVLAQVQEAWQDVKSTAMSFYTYLFKSTAEGESGFQELLSAIGSIATGIAKAGTTFAPFLSALSELGELTTFLGNAWKIVDKVLQVVRDLTQPLFQMMVSGILAFTEEGYRMRDAFKDIFGSIKEAIKNTIEHIKNLGEKILSLVPGLKKAEEQGETKSTFPSLTTGAIRTTQAVQSINSALHGTQELLKAVEQQMASIGPGLASFSDLSPDALLRMAQTPGLATAEGIIGLQRLARQNQPSLSQQAAPLATPAAQDSPIPVQLVGGATSFQLQLDSQETDRFVGRVTDVQRTQHGRITSGFGSGGGGFS